MFESILVRAVFIPLYVLVALFTVVLLWKNSAAGDALKNSGIVLASLMPVLVAVLPYLNAQTTTKNFTYTLFFDSSTKHIITGETPINEYVGPYWPVFANLPDTTFQAENFGELMGAHGLDLIENGIVNKIMAEFSMFWDIEKIEHSIPGARATSMTSSKVPSEKLSLDEIKKIFLHNPIMQLPGVMVMPTLSLPQKTQIIAQTAENSRKILIKNNKMEMSIEILPSMGGVLQQGIPGLFEADRSNMNRYYSISFNVIFKMKPQRLETYSPDMIRYQKWYENISNLLSELDWRSVEANLNKSRLHKAVTKVLKNK